MTLSYSRLAYVEIVFDQTVDTFLRCHINAFNYFNAVPKVIKIDNLKSGVLEASFYEPIIQHQYASFAKHYGFDPIPCKVRTPQEKGKIESGVKFVQTSFICGREFKDYKDMRLKLSEWLDSRCNKRIHGTTRKQPRQLFEDEEVKHLLKLPLTTYKISSIYNRSVQKDCHILLKYNYYSVPYAYTGKDVYIEETDKSIRIFYDYQQIAIHPILEGRGKFSSYSVNVIIKDTSNSG